MRVFMTVMGLPEVPNELREAPVPALEAYCRECILHFNSHAKLAERLNVEATVLRAATEELLSDARLAEPTPEISPPVETQQGEAKEEPKEPSSPQATVKLALTFRHDCQNLSCTDDRCALCAQSQQRRCTRNFLSKYLVGDAMRAACGAVIRVEVVDADTGQAASPQDVDGIMLEAVILNGRALDNYAGMEMTDNDLSQLALTRNTRGGPLLTLGSGVVYDANGRPTIALRGAEAALSNVRVTASSEAMLQGQRPQFALLVRALDGATGKRMASIPPLISEGFIVATQRVRGAAKKLIPHIQDHVSKLTALGKASQAKLQDMYAVATESGLHALPANLHCISTVGQFKELMLWGEADPNRAGLLKRVLKLSKGWDEARDHALLAVADDYRVRLYFTDASLNQALAFRCSGAVPDLTEPVATIQRRTSDDDASPELIATLRRPGQALGPLLTQLKAAKTAWSRPFHPGWAVLDLDCDAFMDQLQRDGVYAIPPTIAASCSPFATTTTSTDGAEAEDDQTAVVKVVTGLHTSREYRPASPGPMAAARQRLARAAALRDRPESPAALASAQAGGASGSPALTAGEFIAAGGGRLTARQQQQQQQWLSKQQQNGVAGGASDRANGWNRTGFKPPPASTSGGLSRPSAHWHPPPLPLNAQTQQQQQQQLGHPQALHVSPSLAATLQGPLGFLELGREDMPSLNALLQTLGVHTGTLPPGPASLTLPPPPPPPHPLAFSSGATMAGGGTSMASASLAHDLPQLLAQFPSDSNQLDKVASFPQTAEALFRILSELPGLESVLQTLGSNGLPPSQHEMQNGSGGINIGNANNPDNANNKPSLSGPPPPPQTLQVSRQSGMPGTEGLGSPHNSWKPLEHMFQGVDDPTGALTLGLSELLTSPLQSIQAAYADASQRTSTQQPPSQHQQQHQDQNAHLAGGATAPAPPSSQEQQQQQQQQQHHHKQAASLWSPSRPPSGLSNTEWQLLLSEIPLLGQAAAAAGAVGPAAAITATTTATTTTTTRPPHASMIASPSVDHLSSAVPAAMTVPSRRQYSHGSHGSDGKGGGGGGGGGGVQPRAQHGGGAGSGSFSRGSGGFVPTTARQGSVGGGSGREELNARKLSTSSSVRQSEEDAKRRRLE